METEYLKEFILLSQGSSITTTAHKLGMSQSCLSKHIKQLELETGGELFTTINGKLMPTSHGAHVLSKSQFLLNSLSILIDECHDITGKKLPELIVQTPSIQDDAAQLYQAFFNQFKSHYTNYQIRYSRISNKHMIANLARGRYDVALAYNYGSIAEIQKRYKKKNCRAVYLTTDKLMVWCKRGHKLDRDNVEINDLKETPIVVPFDVLAPMQKAVSQLCVKHGFKPTFITISTKTQNEFMHTDFEKTVYVYPLSFRNSELISQKTTFVTHQLLDHDAVVHAFIVYSLENNNLSPDFVEYIEQIWAGPLSD